MAGGPTHCTAGASLRQGPRIPPFAVAVAPRSDGASIRPILRALAGQEGFTGHPILVFAAPGGPLAGAAAAIDSVPEGSIELHLLKGDAGGGTVLQAAASQLERRAGEGEPVLLVIDPDAVPASDWIASNLRALEAGADAVCGVGVPAPRGVSRLPPTIDAIMRYRRLAVRLEDALDPAPRDPAPRHGDEDWSLALRLSAFRAAGAAPQVPELAQRHLVLRVRQAGGIVRHCPQTRVFVPHHCLAASRADGLLQDAELPVRVGDPAVLEAALRHRAALRQALRRRYARLAEVERERAVSAHLALTAGDEPVGARAVPVELACRQLRERLGELGEGAGVARKSGPAWAEHERRPLF